MYINIIYVALDMYGVIKLEKNDTWYFSGDWYIKQNSSIRGPNLKEIKKILFLIPYPNPKYCIKYFNTPVKKEMVLAWLNHGAGRISSLLETKCSLVWAQKKSDHSTFLFFFCQLTMGIL